VTAIETDVMFEGGVAVIRHLGGPSSEMTFMDFVAKVAGSKKHIKVDFKDARAVLPALSVLRDMQNELRGQGVWLNADIVHGPGKRWKRSAFSPPVSPDFLELCDDRLPGALWSLGWSVGRLIPFNEYDVERMRTLVAPYRPQGEGVVFAASLRHAALDPTPLKDLLIAMPESQLLLWTGTGDEGIPAKEWGPLRDALRTAFEEFRGRVGLDIKVKPESAFADRWLPDGWYHIVAAHSGLPLSVTEDGLMQGSEYDASEFLIRAVESDAGWEISTLGVNNTKFRLSAFGAKRSSVELVRGEGSTFRFEEATRGRVFIIAESGFAFDVAFRSRNPGMRVQLYSYRSRGMNKQFCLIPSRREPLRLW
jgi:hypothetical protein